MVFSLTYLGETWNCVAKGYKALVWNHSPWEWRNTTLVRKSNQNSPLLYFIRFSFLLFAVVKQMQNKKWMQYTYFDVSYAFEQRITLVVSINLQEMGENIMNSRYMDKLYMNEREASFGSNTVIEALRSCNWYHGKDHLVKCYTRIILQLWNAWPKDTQTIKYHRCRSKLVSLD